ncbi:MAG: hypothetical protein HUJ68_08545 [Clostridia bacterium]|nr:hypothetical protein [Clostridia bacterium]
MNEDDITLDRFTYLFYPDTTKISIYKNEGESFDGGEYKNQSIQTN